MLQLLVENVLLKIALALHFMSKGSLSLFNKAVKDNHFVFYLFMRTASLSKVSREIYYWKY